ncbi:hypothetical protein Gohar_024889 [Gossypium harknessii]|uniref:Uncharacterized protein n=1 Tax=Gossypium harknessii TaxID=34285 RepID=A0A7J9HH93_9ROSI|nr:hypothetical protein [Gossypium harknessii]
MGCCLQGRSNKQWMFPNRRSLKVQDPQGIWTTFCGKWSNTSKQWASRMMPLR